MKKRICKNCIALPICNKKSYVYRVEQCSIFYRALMDKIVYLDNMNKTISSPKKLRIIENGIPHDMKVQMSFILGSIKRELCEIRVIGNPEKNHFEALIFKIIASNEYTYVEPPSRMRQITIL